MPQNNTPQADRQSGRRKRSLLLVLVFVVALLGVVWYSPLADGPVLPDGNDTRTHTDEAFSPTRPTTDRAEPSPAPGAIDISSCSDLRRIEANLSATYVLTRDLECSESRTWNDGRGLVPIGGNGPQAVFFGTFDGRGHTITNLYVENRSANYVGLFGEIGVDDPMDPDYPRAGRVQNVMLKNLTVIGGRLSDTGGLVGKFARGEVTNVTVRGTVKTAGDTGGIAGTMGANASVRRAIVGGRIVNTGAGDTGGVVGSNDGGLVAESAVFGTLQGSNHVDIGGVVGWNGNGSTVVASYSHAAVRTRGADSVAGGIAGSNWPTGTIRHCYAAGPVRGGERTGGLVAVNRGSCPGSFWETNATGTDRGMCGSGLDTDRMQTKEPYTAAGWDFDHAWTMDGYPTLRWVVRGSSRRTASLTPTTSASVDVDLVLGRSDSGRSIAVDPGTVVKVSLPENPSTGYTWRVAGNDTVARVLSNSYQSPSTVVPGAQGTRVVVLEVEQSGTVRLVYVRPWITAESPEREFVVTFRLE
ncbi:MAG: putative secreted protein [Halobacteriales archaeon]|jgi:predicted secreted protein